MGVVWKGRALGWEENRFGGDGAYFYGGVGGGCFVIGDKGAGCGEGV